MPEATGSVIETNDRKGFVGGKPLPPLPANVLAKIRDAGKVDVLVGIPSFNNERTIGHVVRAVAVGLRRHLPGRRAVLVMSDGGSNDRTREVLEQTDIGDVIEILVDSAPSRMTARLLKSHQDLPGKGSALRSVFQIAAELKAPACAVIDGGLASITPQWVEDLLSPVLRGDADFVAPRYARHKYHGTVSSLIVYPLTQALYGKRIRQPMGGEFGFSGRLASRFLECGSWEGPAARYAISLLATTVALAEGHRVAEAFVGMKLEDPQDSPGDLTHVMIEILSTLFDLAGRYVDVWTRISGSSPVPLFGVPFDLGLEPDPVRIDRLATAFRRGTAGLMPVWEAFLSRPSISAVSEAARESEPRITDSVWARIVYETAAGCQRRTLSPSAIIQSFVPLYLGKVATFAAETRDLPAGEAEERLAHLAGAFENEKDLLRSLRATK